MSCSSADGGSGRRRGSVLNERRSCRSNTLLDEVDHEGSRRKGSVVSEQNSDASGAQRGDFDYDLSADLTELRAKFEQRRASECDDQATIITATQIASMLEGDMNSLAPAGAGAGISDRMRRLEQQRPQQTQRQQCIEATFNLFERQCIKPYRRFVEQSFLFDPNATVLMIWEVVLSMFALYNAVYMPLSLALPAVNWPGHDIFEYLLDACFVLDCLVRFRVSYRDHGEPPSCFRDIGCMAALLRSRLAHTHRDGQTDRLS